MADAFEILGLDQSTPARPQSQQSSSNRRQSAAVSTPLPQSAAAATPASQQQRQKREKRKLVTSTKTEKWIHTTFVNSAREDNAQFIRHWERASDRQFITGTEYKFAKLNKKIIVFSYTDEEYDNHLTLLSGQWSKQQTDELFDLCRRFDLRWPVISDRLSFQKSIEEIKDRYYSVARALIDIRATTDELKEKSKQHPIVLHPYDYEHEKKRREQLESLAKRPQESEEREAYITQQLKKIEAIKKRRQEEAKKVDDKIAGASRKKKGKGAASSAESTGQQLLGQPQVATTNSKKSSTPIVADIIHSFAPGVLSRRALVMYREDTPTNNQVDRLAVQHGIFVPPPPDVVGHHRYPLATATVQEAYERFRQRAAHLVELQQRLGIAQQSVSAASSSAGAASSDAAGAPAEQQPPEALASTDASLAPPKEKKKKSSSKKSKKRKLDEMQAENAAPAAAAALPAPAPIATAAPAAPTPAPVATTAPDQPTQAISTQQLAQILQQQHITAPVAQPASTSAFQQPAFVSPFLRMPQQPPVNPVPVQQPTNERLLQQLAVMQQHQQQPQLLQQQQQQQQHQKQTAALIAHLLQSGQITPALLQHQLAQTVQQPVSQQSYLNFLLQQSQPPQQPAQPALLQQLLMQQAPNSNDVFELTDNGPLAKKRK